MREGHLLRRVIIDNTVELLHDCDAEWLTPSTAGLFVVTAKQAVKFVLQPINADAGCLTRLQLYSQLWHEPKSETFDQTDMPSCSVLSD